MTRPIVLSHEAALALPYATSRLVQQGWRVIRIESPAGKPGGKAPAKAGEKAAEKPAKKPADKPTGNQKQS